MDSSDTPLSALAMSTVAIATAAEPWEYPSEQPYLPSEPYAEFSGRIYAGRERNSIYPAFRQLLVNLGLDSGHFGSGDWNPLGDLVKPGQHILIKPNLVRHLHLGGGDYQAVVTHGSVIRCVLDYVALALKGDGQITVGDAPVQSADWDLIVAKNHLREVCDDVSQTWDIPVRLVDFRLSSMTIDSNHRVIDQRAKSGDPTGYRRIDFGRSSLLAPIADHHERYRVTNYDPAVMTQHHNSEINEYLIPQTVLDADVVLNLPKLKTHRKVCLTAGLKNLVGINGHKDWLPHHRACSVEEGGDEYRHRSRLKKFQTRLQEAIDRSPRAKVNPLRQMAIRLSNRLGRDVCVDPFQEGSWYGNDTLWRTVLDLNRLLIYADRQGALKDQPQRRCLTIVDAIVAGDGEGPMEPDPRPCGLLVAGSSPVAVDTVLATIIGFDFRKIPLIANAYEVSEYPLVDFRPEEVQVISSDARFNGLIVGSPFLEYSFKPPAGWADHVAFAAQEAPITSRQ